MIQLAVDFCNCCNIQADECKIVQGLISRGVDSGLITHEVLYPKEEDVNDPGVYVGGTQRIG